MKHRTQQSTLLLFTAAVWMFIICPVILAQAAKYVTVATIGNQVPAVDKNSSPQKVVDQVIEFWGKELKQVLPDKPDLIVLPEYCDFPRSFPKEVRDEYLDVRKDQILNFFASQAKANQCYIAFGMRHQTEDGSWRNSCIVVNREGNVAGIYNKNFPTIGDIKGGVKAGSSTPLIQCDFGTIGAAICFDLNFDELRRTYAELKPDIIVFPSMYHGGLVQNYWAYSCQSFLVGSMAFRDIPSEIRNPLGEVISSTNYFDFAVAKINLDSRLVHLDFNWEKLTRLKTKYGNNVIIKDPGKVGAVLLTSEDPKITVDQMIKEFDIELLDDYLNRSRKFREEPGNRE